MAAAAAVGAAGAAAAAWEEVARAFSAWAFGPNSHARSWRKLGERTSAAVAAGASAAVAAELQGEAQRLAEEGGQQADGWKRSKEGALWIRAAAVGRQALQAFIAWEAEARSPPPEPAPPPVDPMQEALNAAEARAQAAEERAAQLERELRETTETLQAELEQSREAALAADWKAQAVEAAHAKHTAKLQSDMACLQTLAEGFFGPEARNLPQLPQVHELVAAARGRRAAGGPGELGGAVAMCGDLVEALRARQREADGALEPGGWQSALFGIEASRAELADASKGVRAAALGTAPLGEEEFAAAVEGRDRCRAQHLANIQQGMALILASGGCSSADELAAKIEEAKAAVARVEAALGEAGQAQAAEPALGARAAPLPEGVQATWQEALRCYEAYVEGCDVAAATSATEQAVKAFEALGAFKGLVACGVQPGAWSLSFEWDGPRTCKEPAQPPAALSEVAVALHHVHEAAAAEVDRWDALDPVGAFPLRQLLLAGAVELERRKRLLVMLSEAGGAYQALSAELKQEQAVADLLLVKEEVQRELAACDDEHADAELQMGDVRNRESHARRKKGVVDAELIEAAAAARQRLRQADLRFQSAMSRLLDLSRHLPEVARWAASAAVPLPPELLRLWRGCRDLEYFEERHRLEGGHVHEVYRVKDASGWHVVKRYELRGDLKACLAEAALLARLHHPHVVEVTGLFSDLEKYVYMQMTYYSEGDLAQWVKARSPDQASVRRACRQVLLALAHLHEFRVVHSDVKPENVFVDQFGNAFLGDFDVSVDNATRCSTLRLQQTRNTAAAAPQAHFTLGYEAPELLRTGASPQTDVYSYGITVAAACGDGADVAEFVGQLTAQDPAARLTVKQALDHPFFDATRYAVEVLATCTICYDDRRPADQGIFCGSAHFVCGDCLRRYVEDELGIIGTSDVRLAQHQERQGRIRCPHCPSAAPADAGSLYDDAELGHRLPPALFDAYLRAKDRVTENRLWREHQDQLQSQVLRLSQQFQRDLAAAQAQAAASRAAMAAASEAQAAAARAAIAASNEAATREFLRRQYPSAVQCPRCGLGPVIPEGCSDLQAHHGETRARGGRVSNACLGCGFFAADRASWSPWDGNLRARGGG